jgi:WD repeat-containing protein 35
MNWFCGTGIDLPCLAICYEDGMVQILRNQNDSNPVMFSTEIKNAKIEWNNNGTVLAVCGMQPASSGKESDKSMCIVQFWSPMGQVFMG